MLDVLVRVERTRPHLVVALRQALQPELPLRRAAGLQPQVPRAAGGAAEVATAVEEAALAVLRPDPLRHRHLYARDLAATAAVDSRAEDRVRPPVAEARLVPRVARVWRARVGA